MRASRAGRAFATRLGLAVAACLALVAGGCAHGDGAPAGAPAPSGPVAENPAREPLTGATWTLVSLAGQLLPPGARPPTAVFDGTRLSGFGGCNRYTGQVEERTPGTLVIGPLAATKMACPSPMMEVEDRYFATLGRVTQYRRAGSRLVLSGPSGELAFERAAP
jgi:heat shock protein HslJ